jgi:hypothetical protein
MYRKAYLEKSALSCVCGIGRHITVFEIDVGLYPQTDQPSSSIHTVVTSNTMEAGIA